MSEALLIHMPQLVTIERSGYSPDFFAQTMPILVRGDLPTDARPHDAASFAPAVALPGSYVLWMHKGRPGPVPPGLAVLHRGSFFDLFAVS